MFRDLAPLRERLQPKLAKQEDCHHHSPVDALGAREVDEVEAALQPLAGGNVRAGDVEHEQRVRAGGGGVHLRGLNRTRRRRPTHLNTITSILYVID